ncbi:MAG: DNA-binding protein [Telluria sp.]|nr:DNA-binding protein [Telluria sp.]
MQVHVLRLASGDDLRGALETSFAALSQTHGIAAACIVSAVGSLSQAVLRYADKPGGSEIGGPLELLMLSGTLSPDGAHLHGSVADSQGQVKGGHIMPGCIVRTTAEVVIALLPGWEFRRELDAATGLRELTAQRERDAQTSPGDSGP